MKFLVSPVRSVLCLDWCRAYKPSENVEAKAGIPRRHIRVKYQHMSEFKQDRMVGFQEADMSYHDISALIGHAAMTVMHECGNSG